jgi:hypothetical protein
MPTVRREAHGVLRLAPLAALVASLALALAGAGAAAPAFRASVRPVSPVMRTAMTSVSWRPGCPVGLDDLRVVMVSHWDFAGRVRRGTLVVNRDATAAVVGAMRRLYAARFPIRRMLPVDAYGGSDFRSIEADNTSAFNCRPATGSSHWSEHAYGRAIDVNPIENPYVAGGTTSHRASVRYLDRSRARAGVAVPGGVLVDAFAAVGWGWGGLWSGSVRDYQHFSASGR